MKVKSIFIMVLLLLVMPISQAATDYAFGYLDFAGFWYAKAIDGDFNACFREVYTYENKSTAPAQTAISLLAHHTDCQWQLRSTTRLSYEAPEDFPGNSQQYDEIFQSQKPATTQYDFACVNSQQQEIDWQDITMYPSYNCAKGSRYSCTDQSCACYQGDSVCLSDVGARENQMGPLSQFGHVALILPSDGDGVVGVMSDSVGTSTILPIGVMEEQGYFKGIQGDSYDKFKAAVPNHFWGIKYGIATQHMVDRQQAIQILMEAAKQYQFQQPGDLLYTLLPYWSPGRKATYWTWDILTNSPVQVTETLSPTFRCDTFVYYCYLAGAGLKIIDPSITLTPKKLFDAMYTFRQVDHDLENALARGMRLLLLGATGEEDAIVKIFAQETLSIPDADSAVMQYLNDTSISRQEKYTFLWGLTLQYQANTEKFRYLVGTLSRLKPIELSLALIANYHNQKDTINKAVLIEMMKNALMYDSESDLDKMTSAQIQNLVTIKKFLQSISEISMTPKLAHLALNAYVETSSPSSAIKAIDGFMQRKDIDVKSILSASTRLVMLIDAALSAENGQRQFLKPVLAELLSQPKHVVDDVMQQIIFQLSNFNPKDIDADVKPLLLKYVLQQKSKYMGVSAHSHGLTYNWLSAYMTLLSKNEAEKNKMLAKYIVSEKVSVLKMVLFLSAGNNVKIMVKQQEPMMISSANKATQRQALRILHDQSLFMLTNKPK